MDAVFRLGLIPDPGELRRGGVVLRRWDFADLACVEEASLNAVITSGTTVPSPFSDEEVVRFVERQWGRHASGEGLSLTMADVATNVSVGQINLLHRQQPGVVGIAYFVVASRRGQGFAGNAVQVLSRWALSLLAVVRLEALVMPENVTSVSCF